MRSSSADINFPAMREKQDPESSYQSNYCNIDVKHPLDGLSPCCDADRKHPFYFTAERTPTMVQSTTLQASELEHKTSLTSFAMGRTCFIRPLIPHTLGIFEVLLNSHEFSYMRRRCFRVRGPQFKLQPHTAKLACIP